jgi:hypothetical protein
MCPLPEGRSLGVLVAQLQVQEMPSGAKAMTLEDLTRLVNQTLAADPGTGPHDVARVVAAACEKEHVCVSRASGSCVYLRDGTKVVLKRRGAAVWLVVEPQAIIRPADAIAPHQEPKP